MTDRLVIDSNVFIVSLVDESELNEEEKKQRPFALEYIDGLEKGEYMVHLPTIAVVEICGVARWKVGVGPAVAIRKRLEQWVGRGLIRLYDLDERRMDIAGDLVIQHNLSRRGSLSAPDAAFVGLAEELVGNVVSFEKNFQRVSERAVVPA